MRTSLVLSLILHSFVLGAALIGFSTGDPAPEHKPVSVNLVTPTDVAALTAGKRDAERTPEKAAAPSAPAREPEDTVETATAPKPAERESTKQAALPPPKPKALPPQQREAVQPGERKTSAPPEKTASTEAPSVPIPVKRAERPQPRRVAKARAERQEPSPVRKQPEERRERSAPPRRTPDRIAELIDEPRMRAEGESDFNPNRIAALLNRDPTAGGQSGREADRRRNSGRAPSTFEEQAEAFEEREERRVAYGAPEGRDDRMRADEIAALRSQISRCWTPPVGGLGGDRIIVKLRIALNEDGSLSQQPEVINGSGSPFFRPAADSAVRAVTRCQPYEMPRHKYSLWRDMLLTFDPRDMYGG